MTEFEEKIIRELKDIYNKIPGVTIIIILLFINTCATCSLADKMDVGFMDTVEKLHKTMKEK